MLASNALLALARKHQAFFWSSKHGNKHQNPLGGDTLAKLEPSL
jgi:hypothetical protein